MSPSFRFSRLSRVDFTIISARRTMAEQKKLVAAGRSQTMRSRHLTGEALDFVPLDPTTGKGCFDRASAIERRRFYGRGQCPQHPDQMGRDVATF